MNDTDKDAAKAAQLALEELENKLQDIFCPENQKLARFHLEGAWQSLSGLARRSKESLQEGLQEGFKTGTDLISELTRELTDIEVFNLKPKPPAELEVDIKLKREKKLPLKMPVAPLIEIESVIIGKHIHFQSLFDKEKNGLRCSFNQGFALSFKTPLGTHNFAVKGTTYLKHDKNKELVMETPITIPGTQTEISVSIPIKKLLHDWNSKKTQPQQNQQK